jgi:MurNAc alpha-1-phosphate uridylyltransferase
MRAIVLAAGRGERMGELSVERPKPLLRIGGQSLLERQLRRLAGAGIKDVVINLSYKGSQIREHVDAIPIRGLRVRYSEEPDPPLETGGGILRALPLLGDDEFLVINADVVSDYDFSRLQAQTGCGTLVLVDNPAHHPAGDFGIDTQGRATLDPPLLTFAGISLLHPRLFAGWAAGRQPLKPILDAAILRGELRAQHHAGIWTDVGTPARFAEANEMISRGILR